MSAIQQNPFILDKVDLGDTEGFGVGLGLNVDQDTKRSRPKSSSSFRSIQQKEYEAIQQTPKATSIARQESQSNEDQPSSSRSNSSSANLFLPIPPPPRPRRRPRHERQLSHSTNAERDEDHNLDFQIEAALNFVSRHGMNTLSSNTDSASSDKIRARKQIHRNAGLIGASSHEITRLQSDFRKALSRIAEQGENGNGKEYLPTDNAAHRSPRARLRTGSILRAFAKRKPNFSFDSAKNMLGTPAMGFSTPSRTTQMTFDALPETVVGPSNRLGMADFAVWSPQEVSDKYLDSFDQRQRSVSNATSNTSSNRNSRYESQESPNILKRQNSDQSETLNMMAALKAAKEEAREAKFTNVKLMTEMEQMSEELFLQANEMVKEERIKSSALEKELESLKLAMSNVTSSGSTTNDPIDPTQSIEAGAQNENEAMMMAAVAEASRECAEAEEEAEEWRKHCEELESRIAILEEALYNSMALLSQQEGLDGFEDDEVEQQNGEGCEKTAYVSIQDEKFDDVKERESIDENPSRNSLVIPQKAFSESTSSFYSAGDQSSVGFRSPEMKIVSPILSGPSNENESSIVNALKADEIENELIESMMSQGKGKIDGNTDVSGSIMGREDKNAFQVEAESVYSNSSHRSSSSSADKVAILPRSSGIASRRQSRQASLPPRLPEPVSPLPNIPKEQKWLSDSNIGASSSHNLSARLSVATTASRSSSNLKHENISNQINGNQTLRTEGIKTEPIEQISTFDSYSQQHNEINGFISSRKESITTTSTASSPMLQTPPLITATMTNSPYAEKITSTISKRGSTIPVVEEEEVNDSHLENVQNGKGILEYDIKTNGTSLGSEIEKIKRSNNSLSPQVYHPDSRNESDDIERESHETSRAPSYIASSTRPSVRTNESTKKKSRKRNILKNMPPAAPMGRKGTNSIGDEDGMNRSIASVSLYSVISSPSIEGELNKQNSICDQEERWNSHQSKIREHYAKIHQTSPSLQDDVKKKQSFGRRKRFN